MIKHTLTLISLLLLAGQVSAQQLRPIPVMTKYGSANIQVDKTGGLSMNYTPPVIGQRKPGIYRGGKPITSTQRLKDNTASAGVRVIQGGRIKTNDASITNARRRTAVYSDGVPITSSP